MYNGPLLLLLLLYNDVVSIAVVEYHNDQCEEQVQHIVELSASGRNVKRVVLNISTLHMPIQHGIIHIAGLLIHDGASVGAAGKHTLT